MKREEYDEGTREDWRAIFPSDARGSRAKKSEERDIKPPAEWEEWVNSPFRAPEDLVALLHNALMPTRDRAQASALLLAPSLDLVQDWRGTGVLRNAHQLPQDLNLAGCPDILVRFIARQVARSFDYLAANGGLLEHRDVALFYNKTIIEILRHEFWMEVEQWPETKRLVDRYLLTDPRIPPENEHGYTEYGYFMWAHGIPLRFKIQLDDRIRARVMAEKEGVETPRIPRENALECYRAQVTAVLELDFFAGEKAPYPLEMLHSQICFLVSVGSSFHKYYDTLITLFEGPDYTAFFKKLVQ